jgi:pantoate--beta-alanine ligase
MKTSIVASIQALRARLAIVRGAGGLVGLVPTMGALHAGHTSLVDRARGDCDCVVVSIFVNPLQFDREDDLHRYPRPLQADVDLCAEHGVDLVFAPDVADMYPAPPDCSIDVGRLADHLCGSHRPGHFRGVATVVMKLFQIAEADRAYFGEKDAQQLAIIRRIVRDFNVAVEIVGMPTVRESDGLALSSRNQQLTSAERGLATALYAALREAESQIRSGVSDIETIRQAAAARVPSHPTLRLEYLEVVDPDDMQPVRAVVGPVRVAGALWVGSTRLIDNLLCSPLSEIA